MGIWSLDIDLFAEATSSATGEPLGVSWLALIMVATVVLLVPLMGVRQLLKLRAQIQGARRPRHVVGPLERRIVRALFGPQPGDE